MKPLSIEKTFANSERSLVVVRRMTQAVSRPGPLLAKFRQLFLSAMLRLGIVLLRLLHRQSFGDNTPGIGHSAHVRINQPQLDVVHESVGLQFDRFLKTDRKSTRL